MKRIILIGASVLFGLLLLFAADKRAEAPAAPPSGAKVSAETEPSRGNAILTIGGSAIFAVLADTEEELVLGLGKREFLAEDEGMLFVFEQSGAHSFWMKDMQFPIDILWLKEARDDKGCEGTKPAGRRYSCLVVVSMRENAAPESYPEVFRPKEEASYVLEINAGFARKAGIHVGSFLTLER